MASESIQVKKETYLHLKRLAGRQLDLRLDVLCGRKSKMEDISLMAREKPNHLKELVLALILQTCTLFWNLAIHFSASLFPWGRKLRSDKLIATFELMS